MTMMRSLNGPSDRQGHRMPGSRVTHRTISAALFVFALLGRPSAAVAQRPGDYAAERFDVTASVLDGGDLQVTETIRFAFQSGTFRRVWRDIPTARTEGIEIEQASMDGQTATPGDGPGHINITGRNRIRVEWQFEPVGPSTHTFQLRYRARGAVFREGAHDVVRWRLLPSEHKYAIAESRSTIVGPAPPTGPPSLETRRVGGAEARAAEGGIEVAATEIRGDGWIIAEVRYPAGRLISSVPGWQQRHDYATGLAQRWAAAAAGLLVAAFLLLVGVRSGFPRPSFDISDVPAQEPPERLPAAIAAVLATRGRTTGSPAIATIFDLADRGVLSVRELPRSFGVRSYELAQIPGQHDLADHEEEALSIAFADRPDRVSLSKARARLARGGRRFTAALNQDLEARGYLDPARVAVRARLRSTAVLLLIAGAVSAAAASAFIPKFEGWPFLLPLALCAAGIGGVVMAASTTPLSDEGLMQASRWRGFKEHLKSAVKADSPGMPLKPRWLVYGIAVGLAPQWARYLKAHPGDAPKWFEAATRDDSGAFAAFVGSHAASSTGAGAGGAAAGGGGSGAG